MDDVFHVIRNTRTGRVGTVQVQAPLATGAWAFQQHAANYQIQDHSVIPVTGDFNANISGRFNDTTYYTT